jgi:hypothetical protein
MKVYTEINYIWKDNKLVQTDSRSYDYEGEVESCHWYHSHGGGTINTVTKKVTDTYKGSDLDKGIKSGTSATQAALDKVKKDNPNPNLNILTPDQLYEKARRLLHDGATVVSDVVNRNTDSIYTNPDEESTDDPKPKPKPNPNPKPDEEIYGNGVSTASTEGGGYGKQRIGERSRKQANLTGSRNRSILTS